MSRPEQTLMRLVASWGAVIGLCLPAFAETSIPDRERMEVGNALSWQAVIPATANSPGRFGAHYKTRVVIFNPTSRDYTITARFYNDTGPARRSEIQIDAGEYLVWDNFLEEIFDYRGGGAVLLKADDQDDLFYMTAEVYTDSANGRFSTTVVSGIIPTFVSSSQPDFNVGINANRNRRTNIGVWNWETRPSSVEAKVFNGSGRLLQTIRFNLKAEAWQQKNISVSVDNGLVRWEINGESKTHYFYAVEVDNKSNDGTLNWSVNGSTGVVGGNRAPELHRALRGLTLQVGGSAETVALGDHFSDPNGDRLTYVRSITPPGIISTTLVDADLRVTPVAAGTATVTVTARDPGGLEAQGTMEVRVNQDTTTGGPNPGDPRVFDGVEFVWVPPGQFQMGSTSSEANQDEQPLTQVRISRGFWMGKYEVTQAQWQSVMGSNPSDNTNCGGDCPVEQVSWNDVQEFIGKLNARSGGRPYRLPTEAEWEYAARAGTTEDRYGDLDEIAWYGSNSGGSMHRVGQKAANAWGLHDMLGNVWEWVQDWYGSYPGGSVTDPTGPGSGSFRVNRGGSWGLDARDCRSAYRSVSSPGYRNIYLGVRLLREGGTGEVGGNRAPELHRALRGLTLQVGGSAETVALGDHFSDPNGDRLTYVRSITPPGIISTTLVDADLRVTPVAAGTATVTVTARDPGGLEAQGTMEVRVNQDTTTGDPNPGDPRVFDGVEFVWVPPGQFQMGSTSSEADGDERPLTQVRISRGFWMGKYEVTQARWQAVMGSNPSRFKNCGGDCPVEGVSWEDVQEFIGKLNARSGGRPYRLPTEAEWEYAARAGTTGERHGDLDVIAWYSRNSGRRPHPVGQKAPNAWDLYDMLGNVYEWVQDRYGRYPGGTVTDPVGPESGSRRVNRGGSWIIDARFCRSANRDGRSPGYRRDHLGFRLLREGGTGVVGGNRAPELHRALRGLTLQVGGSAETVALGDHFSDPNGDRLTYVRSITPAGIISTTLVDADLRVRPVAAGTATVTVTARDPGGLEAQGTMEVRVNQDTTTGDPNPGDPRVFDGVEFVWVPPGQFQMGSISSAAQEDEQPLTQVRISRGFWMGKYEVTQAQWQSVMGSNPSHFTNCGGDCPVGEVSWEDVQEFIGKLNARSGGRPYRLPTEAEWEYAARAGTMTDTYAGDLTTQRGNDPVLNGIAWYDSNSGETPHRVGEKAANAWGLHDMLGNVWEWVPDWYGSYPGGSVTDPTGPGAGSDRVIRGGSWFNFAWSSRSANRFRSSPGNRFRDLGFRLLREGGTGGGGGNRAPELHRALRGLTLQVGGSAETVALGDHFSDPNGDRLTYVRSITPAGIISTTLVDADLRVRPVAAGTATVTVTARDPGGLEAQGTMEVRVNQDTTTGDPNPGDPRVFDGVEFVWVPPGQFQMGSTSSESFSDERPVTQVRISRGFWMGKYEVTQAQWEAVMGRNPSRLKNCGGDCPVERVSWRDVQEFIGKLNARSGGRPYRLPTEAEWEYAARAGTTEERYGDLDAIAWYIFNSGGTPHRVGEKAANAWGLHDMLGNVYEWVQDWYGSYPGGSVTDPTGPGSGSARVIRGGSWIDVPSFCRSASRNRNSPGVRGSLLGVRLLREE